MFSFASQRALGDILYLGGNTSPILGVENDFSVHGPVAYFEVGTAAKGCAPDHELVDDHAKRKDVRTAVDVALQPLLRRHVPRRSHAKAKGQGFCLVGRARTSDDRYPTCNAE